MCYFLFSNTSIAWNLSMAGSPKKWKNMATRRAWSKIRPMRKIWEIIFKSAMKRPFWMVSNRWLAEVHFSPPGGASCIALCSSPFVKLEIGGLKPDSHHSPIFMQSNYFSQKYLEITSCAVSVLTYILIRGRIWIKLRGWVKHYLLSFLAA